VFIRVSIELPTNLHICSNPSVTPQVSSSIGPTTIYYSIDCIYYVQYIYTYNKSTQTKHENPLLIFGVREGVVATTIDARSNHQGNMQCFTLGEQEKPLYSHLEQGRGQWWLVSTRVKHKNPLFTVGMRGWWQLVLRRMKQKNLPHYWSEGGGSSGQCQLE